jgi:hypothetical protein
MLSTAAEPASEDDLLRLRDALRKALGTDAANARVGVEPKWRAAGPRAARSD